MPEIKNTFLKSKMNKDLDARLLPNGEYREAMNVSISKSEGQGVGSLENIRGNEVSITLPTDITNADNTEIIGKYVDVSRDRVFLFVTSYSDGSSDQLSNFNVDSTAIWGSVEVNCFIVMLQYTETTVSSTILVKGNFLNFSKTHPILGINIIEDLLFWTDNRNQPRRINVDKAISDNTYYDSEDKISLLKYYPYNPIRLYDNDGTVSHTKTTMKNVTQKWLPSTNAPVIAFPGGTTYGTPATLSWPNDPDNPSTLTAGNYIVCYAYYDYRDSSSSNPWFSDKFSDGIVREFLPSKSITGSNINHGLDTRCSHLTYKVASNQLVRCLDTRSTTDGQTYELRQDNDCRLISARIEYATMRVNYNSASSPPETNISGNLWKFIIWAPKVSGAVNPDLTTLTNIIGTRDSLLGSGGAQNNDPGIPKAKLFFHYPNPDYEKETQVDEQFLKQKFVRFAYRFKYEDDEYSLISPFTQNVFIPEQFGHFMEEDELLAKKSKDVHFMENYINDVLLYVDLPYQANQLKEKLGVKEIEILFKDSDEVNIKYIDSIDVDSITSSDTFVTYQYKSSKPIKVIPESENTRVSDKAPVRALAQETVGNRVIFGNFIDKLKAPDTLLYSSFVSSKLTYPYASNDISTFAQREYPLHNLKNNRTYQVGFVLYDRYGRASDVITSTFDRIKVTSDAEPGSTVYAPYKKASGWNAMRFFGDSLRIRLYDYIPTSLPSDPDYKGIYSSSNPLGWYSYKVVVKQQEQEYYNIYVPGIQTRTGYERGWSPETIDPLSYVFSEGTVVSGPTTFVNPVTGVISTPTILDLFDFDYKGVTPRYQIEISGDNINKIPKSLTNVGPVDKEFAGSDTGLFVRVAPQHWNRSFQHFITGDYPTPDKVESIREFNTFNIEPNETIRITPYVTFGSSPVAQYNFDNAPLVDFYNGGNILNKQSSLLIGSVSSKNCDANRVPGPPTSAYERNSRWVNLGVIETTPVKSELNLFWETATTGLISDLNSALTAAGGPDIPNQLLSAASPYNAEDLDFYEAPVEFWGTGGAGSIIDSVVLGVPPSPITTTINEQQNLIDPLGGGGVIPGFSANNPAFSGTTLNITNTKLNSSSTTPFKASLTSSGLVSGLESYTLKNTGNYDFVYNDSLEIDFRANLHTRTYDFSETTTVKNLDPHFWYIYGIASPQNYFATRAQSVTGIDPIFKENTHANNYEPINADMDSDSQIPVVGGQYNSNNKVRLSGSTVYGIQARSLRDIMDQRPTTAPTTNSKIGSTYINSGCYRQVGNINIQIVSSRWYDPDGLSVGNPAWVSSTSDDLWEAKKIVNSLPSGDIEELYIRTKNLGSWDAKYTSAPPSTTTPNHEITFRASDGVSTGSTYVIQIYLFTTG